MKHYNIAIDGPAGSGKSTVARALANRLGIIYLDTGAMYRAMAYYSISCGIKPTDISGVLAIIDGAEVVVAYDAEGYQHVLVGGKDVTDKIRTPEISKGASDIAVIPAVRVKLVETQRSIAREQSVVLDGRDIGTYVLPNAEYKFYITASATERAKRRLAELHAKGMELDKSIVEMTAEILARDKTDSTREFAPLSQAADAIYIDTTKMTIDEVIRTVLDHII